MQRYTCMLACVGGWVCLARSTVHNSGYTCISTMGAGATFPDMMSMVASPIRLAGVLKEDLDDM